MFVKTTEKYVSVTAGSSARNVVRFELREPLIKKLCSLGQVSLIFVYLFIFFTAPLKCGKSQPPAVGACSHLNMALPDMQLMCTCC